MNAPHFNTLADGGTDTELLRQAERAGIATQYSGFWGETVSVGPHVLRRALSAMGKYTDARAHADVLVAPLGETYPVGLPSPCNWELRALGAPEAPPSAQGHGDVAELPATLAAGYYELRAARQVRSVLVAPAQCWLPEGLRQGARWWGVTTQMYALRSERSWGIGDFTDLAQCAALAAAQGAAFVGVSPLHALRPGQPEAASPYSPSSRVALNVLH
ncbi:MAG: 4-alpha-glucanotransferase, partial [Comamonadaceae bacterium]